MCVKNLEVCSDVMFFSERERLLSVATESSLLQNVMDTMPYFGKSDFKCIFAPKMQLHPFCRYRSTLLEKVDLQVFCFFY